MCLFPDEDDAVERNSIPLSSLRGFYNEDSLKKEKKKNRKSKEGKMSIVKKRKKEVRCISDLTSDMTLDLV